MRERRRYRRVTLRQPIRASVGSTPVFVLDASRGGLRVAHRSKLPAAGAICRVDLPSLNGAIQLDCAIVNTVIQHAAAAAESLFHSGLQFVSTDPATIKQLEKLVGLKEE